MTGRVGGFDLGLLYIRTDDEEASGARPTSFSVVRLKRDILRQSSIGLLVTERSVGLGGPESNTAYGVDGSSRSWRTGCRSTRTGRRRRPPT